MRAGGWVNMGTLQTPPTPSTEMPSNMAGIYLHIHAHRWSRTGSHTWPSGQTDRVFTCAVCGDVICTGGAS